MGTAPSSSATWRTAGKEGRWKGRRGCITPDRPGADRRAELQGAREITASDAALGGQALRRDRGRTAPRRGLTAAPVEPLTPLRYPDHRHAGAAHDENGHPRCTDK